MNLFGLSGARSPARVVALCLWVLAAGCGYRFTAGSGGLPEGAKTWNAPVFENRTAEPNIEVLYTQAFREQLVRHGVEGGASAQAWVKGEVLSISSAPTLIRSYRVTVAARLSLLQGERVLLSTTLSEFEEYQRGRDPIITETNRQAAIRRLADLMMKQGYERLASGG